MSYCRFSSMDYGCDIYAFDDVGGGVTVHVAGNRVQGDIPKLPPWTKETNEAFFEAHQAQMRFLETAERKDIGLSRDGESFFYLSPDAAVELLRSLKDEGYVMPEGLTDAIQAEYPECFPKEPPDAR